MSVYPIMFRFVPFVLFFITCHLAFYILGSLGLYSMANNTGVKDSWLAWIPGLNHYLLGSLADRYQSSVGKKSLFRLFLPLISVFSFMIHLPFWFFVGILYLSTTLDISIALFFISLIGLIFTILEKAIYLITFYHVMKDYEPSRAVAYTILAFFALEEVVLFVTRNKVPVGIAGRSPSLQPKYNVHSTF